MRYIYKTAGGIAKRCLILYTIAGVLVGTVQGGELPPIHHLSLVLVNPSLWRTRLAHPAEKGGLGERGPSFRVACNCSKHGRCRGIDRMDDASCVSGCPSL